MNSRTRSQDLQATGSPSHPHFLVAGFPKEMPVDDMSLLKEIKKLGHVIKVDFHDSCTRRIFFKKEKDVNSVLHKTKGVLRLPYCLVTLLRQSSFEKLSQLDNNNNQDHPTEFMFEMGSTARVADPRRSVSHTTVQTPYQMEDGRWKKRSNSTGTAGTLGLPPPYHILPDTPYFRRAPIVPPPLADHTNLPFHPHTINRYLSSMTLHDEMEQMREEDDESRGLDENYHDYHYDEPDCVTPEAHVTDHGDWNTWDDNRLTHNVPRANL